MRARPRRHPQRKTSHHTSRQRDTSSESSSESADEQRFAKRNFLLQFILMIQGGGHGTVTPSSTQLCSKGGDNSIFPSCTFLFLMTITNLNQFF